MRTTPISIAYEGIQQRRSEIEIPIPPYGILHDYIPFYFAPRSPMLYAIHKGMILGYSGRQEDIIYLVSSVQIIVSNNIPFVFTDGHAIMRLSEFYNQSCDLDKIDWQIMKETYWNDNEQDGDRKRRRQAEFLVKDSFPIRLLKGIAVKDKESESDIRKILEPYGILPPIRVKYDWYY